MVQLIDSPDIAAIVLGIHSNPFAVLGMHKAPSGNPVVRAFLPGVTKVSVIETNSGKTLTELECLHETGFFEGICKGHSDTFRYRLKVCRGRDEAEQEDPYRFGTIISDHDQWLFGEGQHYRLYDMLGAHPDTIDNVAGTRFAVWAPNAKRVSVVGDFNGWDGRIHVMRLRPSSGIWEIFLPSVGPGSIYKYEILAEGGRRLPLKTDPFAFSCQKPPDTASVVPEGSTAKWHDGQWMEQRCALQTRQAPVSIYEVHAGSWRRADGNRYLTYAELADHLIPYVKDMGFTHIELLPISEFPFDGSWGYQPIGMFAPTSRFGTPDDFQAFVERCHEAGLALIIDWVPAHFPTDEHGLGLFDGTHLYEHADPRKGRHTDWNTLIYNYGRHEVVNYLISNALFWAERYHVDGLRVDGVASMLYLDYSRKEGEWIPNEYGGNENLEAVQFLKRTNEQLYSGFPGIITVAEESTAWPQVSQPTYLGGLGFGFKWNMGWMHDTLNYMSKDPVYRRYHHDDMTFGLIYAFSENFILPLSHDEVVHGKGSLLGKMAGDHWQKFANLRNYFAFMYTHPGKKLVFMGSEFAQEREWNHDIGLDWNLVDDPMHRGVQMLVRDLNKLYREEPALHQRDCQREGFEWIDATDVDNSVFSYLRLGGSDDDISITVCNFTPIVQRNYRIGVPHGGSYLEKINTDAEDYGGSGVGNLGHLVAEPQTHHGRPFSLNLTLPPLAALILQPVRD